MSRRTDLYDRITGEIVAQLERGVRPWHQPWNAKHAAGSITRPLRHNGKPYSGVNILMLWIFAEIKGYSAPLWMTFKQALDLGGHVRKGEKSSPVVYADTFNKKDTDPQTGEELSESIKFLKQYAVFNVEQIEGLPAHFYARAEPPRNLADRLESAERFFDGAGADFRHGGNRAFYNLAEDYIQLPPYDSFRSRESYYATVAHEVTHWTRHRSRLDRSFGQKRFGDHAYAMEELVAELGSAFLAADLGITPEVIPDHASYLDCWLKVLKQDSRAIFTAAAHAQKAADYLHAKQLTQAAPAAAGIYC